MTGIARLITLFTPQEIKSVFKSARTISRQPGIDIRIAPAANSFGKILIVTPRKVGTAPERNRLRRRLKAIFYQEKLYHYPYTVIVFCTREATALTFCQLHTILTTAIDKLP